MSITDLIGSSLSHSRDDALIREGLNILKSISCDSGVKGLIRRVLNSIPKVVAMIVLKQLVTDPSSFFQMLKSLIWTCIRSWFYRREVVRSDDTYLRQEFEELNSVEVVNLVPLYQITENENENEYITIEYIPQIHGNYIQQCKNRADEKQSEKSRRNQTSKFRRYISTYQCQTPSQLFPSSNFQRLEEVIDSEIKTSELLNSYSVLGMLIDGEPGLGKSSFSEYIATTNTIDIVYRVDLSTRRFLSRPDVGAVFDEIFTNVPILKSSLFMIDEMDKYLEYTIQQSYDALIEETKKDEKLNLDDIISFEDHSRRQRIDFLYSLLSILERSGLNHPCIVVFCSNNFDTIFGDLDMTHFRSIQDRFVRFRFNRMGRDEIMDYLRYHNHKFEDTDFYFPDLELLMDSLDPNISITARKMHQIAKLASYNFERIIDQLNAYDPTPPSSPAMSSSSSSKPKMPSIAMPSPKTSSSSPKTSKSKTTSSSPSKSKTTPSSSSKSKTASTSPSKSTKKLSPPTIDMSSPPSIDMLSHHSDSDEDDIIVDIADEIPDEISDEIPDELKPYIVDINPDAESSNWIYAFRCPDCGRGRLRNVFCDCATCGSHYDPSTFARGSIVEVKCHHCLHPTEPINVNPDYINTNEKDKKKLALMIKLFLDTVTHVRGPNKVPKRKKLAYGLFTYLDVPDNINILNQSTMGKLRWTMINKVFEFVDQECGFVTANIEPFEHLCNRLLPIKY